jgi:hypothetical protein
VVRDAIAALVFVAICFAIAISVVLSSDQKKTPTPIKEYAPCQLYVSGPMPIFMCSNGHAYLQHDGGRFQDLGPRSPGAQVPKN